MLSSPLHFGAPGLALLVAQFTGIRPNSLYLRGPRTKLPFSFRSPAERPALTKWWPNAIYRGSLRRKVRIIRPIWAAAFRERFLRPPEVGRDHLCVGKDLLCSPNGERSSESHGKEAVGALGDEPHVVIDHQSRDARTAQLTHMAVQSLAFGLRASRRGLVEQEESRLRGHGAGEIHQPLGPVR